MTPIADMVERMLANNDPPEAIVAAVRALESVTLLTRDVTADVTLRSREQNRLRQVRFRERHKDQQVVAAAKANDVAVRNAVVTRDVTLDASEHCDLSSLTDSPRGQQEERKPTASVVEGRRKGTRLAAGSLLSDVDRAFAVGLGVDADRAWAEFVDFWIGVPGQRGTKLDWSATWRNRVRQLQGMRKQGNSNGKPTVHDAAKELSRRLSELDEPAPSGELFEQAGRSVVRLIPSR